MGDVLRFDFGKLGKLERTPQGGIRVPANLTRVGVFNYRREDGSTRKELRLPEEVFAEDSLETLRSAPVTDLHPKGSVRATNWRKLAVGHVSENVKKDGQFVSAPLLIQDQEVISAVEREDRKELSCGYTCHLDSVAGVHETFGPYDAIQRGIRYNHVALGPANWGRAGNEVALRLDSGDAVQEINDAAAPKPAKEEKKMAKVRIDGIDYEAGSPEHLQAQAKLDAAKDKELADLKADNAAEKKRADEADAKHDVEKKRADEAEDPKKLEEAITARVELHTDARSVLGADADFKGKSDRDVMIETIKHADDKFDAEGKSDDYLRAYFDSTAKSHKRHDEGGTGIGAARSAAAAARKDEGEGSRKDGGEEDRHDARAAQKRMNANNRDAATKDLRFTRKD